MPPKGKDKVTRAQINAIIAEAQKRNAQRAAATKAASAAARSTAPPLPRSVRGDVNDLPSPDYTRGGAISADPYRDSKGGRNGKYRNLPVEVQKMIDRQLAADSESAQMGEPRKKKQSLFNRAVDVLLRGQYASAEAFKEGFDPNTKAFYEPGEALKGFWSGLQGKEKTNFKDVLKQHGHTGKGMGTLGFVLDVAADPTTYLGFGLVAKGAMKGGKLVEDINETAAVINRARASGQSDEFIQSAVQARQLPVQNLRGVVAKARHSKGFTPEGRELYKVLKDSKPKNPSNFVENIFKKVKNNHPAEVRSLLHTVDDDALRKSLSDALEEQVTKYPGLRALVDRVLPNANPHNTWNGVAFPRHASSKGESSVQFSRQVIDPIDAKLTTKWYINNPKYASVPVKTPEEFARRVVIHELGHHVGFVFAGTKHTPAITEIIKKHAGPPPAGVDAKRHYAEWVSENLGEYGAGATNARAVADPKVAHPHDMFNSQDELLAESWAEYQILGDKARPFAKEVAQYMEKHLPKGPSFKDTQKILRELAEDAALASNKVPNKDGFANDVGGNIEPWVGPIKAEKIAKDTEDLYEDLLRVTAKNLSSTTKKQFQIKVGPTAFGIPKVAQAAAKGAKAIYSIPGIKQSVDKFNEMFRANAHIPESMRYIRAKEQTVGINLITHHIRLLQSVFKDIPKADRESVMKALRDGAIDGSSVAGGLDLMGKPVTNVARWVHDEIRAMDISLQRLGMSYRDINRYLPPSLAIRETEKIAKGQRYWNNEAGQWEQAVQEITNPNFIYNAIMNSPIKDPQHALYSFQAALNQAIARYNMMDNIIQTHGAPLKQNKLTQELVDKFGWVKIKNVDGEEWAVPDYVPAGIEQINKVFGTTKDVTDFTRMYDRALQTFKAVVTKYNPSFHNRTFLGEMILGQLGGMKNIPRSYAKAGKVYKGRNKEFIEGPSVGAEFGENAPAKLIEASNVLRGAMPGSEPGEGAKVIIRRRFGKKTEMLTADKIWHLFLSNGLKGGYASIDLIRAGQQGATLRTTKVSDAFQQATENVEDYGRLAHFIDVLEHSKAKSLDEAVEEAANVVRKYHLDYTNTTPFEQRVMSRAVPFYKWLRLSTPLMAEIILTQPGKALVLPKAMRDISEMLGYEQDFGAFPGGPDAVVPEWLRDHGAVPVGEWAGNTNYFDPTALLPMAGSAELANGNGRELFETLHPAFKILSDIKHGSDAFGNQLRGEGSNTADRINYAAAQTPQTNFINQMVRKKDPDIPRFQTVASFLGNPGIQPNTPKRMKGEAFRQQQEAYSHRKRVKEKYGIQP